MPVSEANRHSGVIRPTPLFSIEAQQLAASGQFKQAVEVCKRGLVYFPEHIMGYVVLARTYLALDQNRRALNVLRDGYRRTGARQLELLRAQIAGENSAYDNYLRLESDGADLAAATTIAAAAAEPTLAEHASESESPTGMIEESVLLEPTSVVSQEVPPGPPLSAPPSPRTVELPEQQVPTSSTAEKSVRKQQFKPTLAAWNDRTIERAAIEQTPVEPAAAEQIAIAPTVESTPAPTPVDAESTSDAPTETNPKQPLRILAELERPGATPISESPIPDSHREERPERREEHTGARTIGMLALHKGSSVSRLRSSNLRLIPGLEFAPLRHEDNQRRQPIAPLINEPMPEPTLRPRQTKPETRPTVASLPPLEESVASHRIIPPMFATSSRPSPKPIAEPEPPSPLNVPTIIAAEKKVEALTPLEELARRLENARIPVVEEEEQSRPSSFEPSIVSDTLANILVAQGAYAEALKAFQTLARAKPERLDYYETRIAEMKERMQGATRSKREEVTDSADNERA